MSSFQPWIDDANINATQDYTTFVNDEQRQEGFKGGTPASAIRVNTALRQSSLVVCALMNALNVSDELNYRSSVTDMQNAILTQLKAVKVNNANIATYASSDYSKGTIEERLTNLGFKQGSFIVENQSSSSVDDNGEPYATVLLNISVNEIKRQGNYCIANLKVDFDTQANPNYTGGSSSVTYSAKVTVPEEFRPKQTVTGYFAGTTKEVATGYVPNYVNIYADGRVTFKYWSYWSGKFVEGDATYSIGSYIANLGWEASPIT